MNQIIYFGRKMVSMNIQQISVVSSANQKYMLQHKCIIMFIIINYCDDRILAMVTLGSAYG